MPPPVDGHPIQQTVCQLISFCDSVKLFLDKDTVCAGSPATFTCRINPECGSRPTWYFDTTNLQSYSIPNDSTLQVVYREQYQGAVSSRMNGTCRSLSDSKILTVLHTNKPVTLGEDAFLCPDSSLVLRAAAGYNSYSWQDGSAADSFLVQTPGKYYVTVTNTCGVPSSDTAIVQEAPGLNFSIGPDLSVCINASVILQAPSGYLNYQWKDQNGNTINETPDIYLTPPSSTTYSIAAQTSLGCAVKDTVAITVNIPLPISLGRDTSFCTGDSVLLQAGNGFLNYAWSNGSSNASIYATTAGAYFVKAQSPNGCYSSDTMQVLHVYALPEVALNPKVWLCEGEPRQLDAGSGYARYVWQDGSGSSTFSIDTTGTYWVEVTDRNGCTGSDTITINQIIPSPTNFLSADTLICDGYPAKIQARPGFTSYLWSSGDAKDYMTTRKAGNYSLTVTDDHGCSATAYIAVSTKQCLFGIYFPNAFSPNGDGINEVFRPSVFGNLSQYHLQIFNRWGQQVFETSDYTKGWIGKLGGADQPVGTYVWISRYAFEGKTEKVENGTLLLIR
ncbi:MAG TPA: gliding motility-associated C-terminal domain-containing protein [Puia sp.]|nr:gliding motility-associated C-terminal domain-containing protein [Puia sp.]